MDKSIDPKVAEGLQIAYRARDVLGLAAETPRRIREQIHAVAYTRVLPLPEGPPQPDQLARRALRLRLRSSTTTRRCCAATTASTCTRFTQGFKTPQIAGGATNVGPSYRFIYQSNAPAEHPRNLDSRRVREHDAALHLLVRPRARGGHGAAARGGHPAAARLDPARAVRLLDPRRVHELGHRLELRALDEGQGVGLRAAGAARDRHLADVPAARSRGRAGRSTSSTAACASTSTSATSTAPRAPFRPSAAAVPHRRAGHARDARCSGRGWPPTPRAPSRPAWAACPPREPPPFYAYDADIGRLAVSTRALLDRDPRRQPRQRPLRRHRPRPPLRRRRRPDRRHGRPPAGVVRRASSATAAASASDRQPARPARRPEAPAADAHALAARPRHPPARARRRAPTPGPFERSPSRRTRTATASPSPAPTRSASARSTRPGPIRAPARAAGRVAARAVLFPTWGRGDADRGAALRRRAPSSSATASRLDAARRSAVLPPARRATAPTASSSPRGRSPARTAPSSSAAPPERRTPAAGRRWPSPLPALQARHPGASRATHRPDRRRAASSTRPREQPATPGPYALP